MEDDREIMPLGQTRCPTTSVAMGTYNGSRFLAEQLSSIARQSVLPNELVICDDGSNDTTAQIITEFARSAPFEVRFVQNSTCLGIAKNFEKAIMLCRCEIIALADQDDLWNPQKVSRCLEVLEHDRKLGGVFSDAELIDEHSALLGRRLWSGVPFHPHKDRFSSAEFVRLLLRQDVATAPTIVFRSEWRDSIVPIPATWMQDAWIAWMLVLYSCLGFIRDPLMQYRIHPDQQLGLASSSPRDRLVAIRKAGSAPYSRIAGRFEDLRDRLLERPCSQQGAYLRELNRKIKHLHSQTNLASNRLMRSGQIMLALPSYMRYTRGIATICRDLLF